MIAAELLFLSAHSVQRVLQVGGTLTVELGQTYHLAMQFAQKDPISLNYPGALTLPLQAIDQKLNFTAHLKIKRHRLRVLRVGDFEGRLGATQGPAIHVNKIVNKVISWL